MFEVNYVCKRIKAIFEIYMQKLQNHFLPFSKYFGSTSTQKSVWYNSWHLEQLIIATLGKDGIRHKQYTFNFVTDFILA